MLPFGVTKGPDGVPVPHPERHPGLVLAFELAAEVRSDREVAQSLNAAGYRTSGNRKANPFTKDTVRVMPQNRFYLGELPDGNGESVPGEHGALIDPAIFEAVQAARARNTNRRHRIPTDHRTPWALSGLATCGNCGRSLLAHGHANGRQRVLCSGRTQGLGCEERAFYADLVERQVGENRRGFALPAQQQADLVAAWTAQQRAAGPSAARRATIQRKLDRLKEAYPAGDIDRAEWHQRQAPLTRELDAFPADLPPKDAVAKRLAGYLADVAGAREDATPAERNELARALFADVAIAGRTAVAGNPLPQLRPFFAAMAQQSSDAAPAGPGAASTFMRGWRKRRGSVSRVHPAARVDPVRLYPRTAAGRAVAA